MCGRYRLTAKERYLRDHFGLDEDHPWTPRWNITPTCGCDPPGYERTEAQLWPAPLGPCSLLGQKRIYWIEDDQCDAGNRRRETSFP